MKFVFYTNSVSAHQLPLARELVARLGADNYRYVYTGDSLQGGGQEVAASEPWIVRYSPGDPAHAADPTQTIKHSNNQTISTQLESCDVLMTGGLRPIDLIERRAAKGLTTFYQSERWFKPLRLFDCLISMRVPGWMRMLVPGYRRMAKRFVSWLKTDPNARCLAIGPWARKDFEGLGVPAEKIVDWGYFVSPSTCASDLGTQSPTSDRGTRPTRVLWVGRMLDWKRVNTIIRAVALANRMSEEVEVEGGERKFCSLTLVGDGPERPRLERLATKLSSTIPLHHSTTPPFHSSIHFHPPVPIADIRPLMRTHDIYVLASNTQEGWGAALNEAMEEGMTCFGTYEAGASAAMLPPSHLFHAGDAKALAKLLIDCEHPLSASSLRLPAAYSPRGAAERLMELIGRG